MKNSQRKTYVNDFLQFFTFVLDIFFQRSIKIMSEGDCVGVLCGSCLYMLCVCICEDRPHRSRDNQRVEVLFRPREGDLFSKLGFKLEETTNAQDDCCKECDDCCKECCSDDCCDEGNGLTTSSQVVSVTRGGLAESLGVQVGWGLERVGEMDVHEVKTSTIRQIVQMVQPPVVLTFMLPRGARAERGADPTGAPAYTPPHLEISRHDNGNQIGPVVRPD